MKFFKYFSIILFIPLFCFGFLSETNKKNRMVTDLEIIKNAFEISYAPAKWKKTHLDWSIESAISQARTKIRNSKALSVKQYQSVIRDLFFATKDFHVDVTFHSTESASLPFRVKGANGRYFIAWVDSSKPESFYLKIGDELLLFDNKPIQEIIDQIKVSESRSSHHLTDQAFAEIFLTERIAAIGQEVPKGQVNLTILSKASNAHISLQAKWDYHSEKIKNDLNMSFIESHTWDSSQPLGTHSCFHKNYKIPVHNLFNHSHDIEKEILGNKESFLPALGKIVWQTPKDSHFHAYIFETPTKRKIGYIRISDYTGDSHEAMDFSIWIKFFQESTEAMVIDQLNNPGGSLWYMYALTSMLTEKPLKTISERSSITQEDILCALDFLESIRSIKTHSQAVELLGSTICGYQVSLDVAKAIANKFLFTINEWNSGNHVTHLFPPHGLEFITPHSTTRYTKPLLILVNELDFSCGDIFPAIMQDNQRATIFGCRTAGAGGFVNHYSYPNLFGIADFSLTGSIAERANGLPIEDLGVTPDIEYYLTDNDLQNNYQDYIEAVLNALEKLK